MRDRTLLLVDLSNQAYKAAATNPHLEGGGFFTGGLYGIIGALAKAISVTGATDIVICTDTKPYVRSTEYPEYKAARTETRNPELRNKTLTTVGQFNEMCKATGWPVWSVQGFESDDLIAFAVINYRGRYKKIVAMSNDSDLYQLFEWPHFVIYKGKKGIYTHKDYEEEWKIPVEKYVKALSLTGTHNEVSGIPNVGPATAMKAVMDLNKLAALQEKYGEVIERNEKLIKLPHYDFPDWITMPLRSGKYNERNLVMFLSRYEIKLQRWQSELFEQLN